MRPATLWWWSTWAYRRRWKWLARLLKAMNYVLFRCILPYEAHIERDLILVHLGLGVVVHPNVVIGHRVRFYHNVTIATSTFDGSEHKIIIEDDADIGAGAIVIARSDTTLTIGARARVGAGAFVTHDVAPDTTVVGVPACPIRRATGNTQEITRFGD